MLWWLPCVTATNSFAKSCREDGNPPRSSRDQRGDPCIKIGLGLKYETVALNRLALSALVHDVGMMTIPEALLMKVEPLTVQERMLIDRHPQQGFDLLMGLGSQYEWLAVIARQEHERWRGQGYPSQLNCSEIHEHALIIGLADVFDALISSASRIGNNCCRTMP